LDNSYFINGCFDGKSGGLDKLIVFTIHKTMQLRFKNIVVELLLAVGAGVLVALFWQVTGLYEKYPQFMYYVVGAVAALVGIMVKAKRK